MLVPDNLKENISYNKYNIVAISIFSSNVKHSAPHPLLSFFESAWCFSLNLFLFTWKETEGSFLKQKCIQCMNLALTE